MKDEVLNRIRNSAEDLINDKKSLVKVLAVVMILLLAAILRIHGANKADIKIENVPEAETAQSAGSDVSDENAEADAGAAKVIFVDIGGAVNKPGVYQVAAGTRLFQVIEMAGGLTEEADTNSVNQASFVEDGSKVIIPSTGDPQTSAGGQEAGVAASGVTPADALININIASKEELTTLNGIGDAIAERIIEYRASNRFKNKEDIMSVKGIGSATYDKIKDKITV